MARADRHWSGFHANNSDDAYRREMADALVRLGFSQDAAKWLVAQGIKRPDKLAKMSDDLIDKYVSTCRKPGGGEPGFTCPMDAVELLKLAAFGGRHMTRVDREFEAATITEDWCSDWQEQLTLEMNWDNNVPAEEYPKSDMAKNPARLFEALETLLGRIRGVDDIPLTQVVRADVQPPPADEDPACGEDESRYLTHDDEIIARAPILRDPESCTGEESTWDVTGPFCPTYLQNRKKVWEILKVLCFGTFLYVHIKKYRTDHNGRGAWFALKEFLMGKDHVARMVREMQHELKTLTYKGEGRRGQNFQRFRTSHVEQHDIAVDLQQYGFPGLSEDQKVNYFLDGIKTPALDVAKATVRANDHLKSEFTACAAYLSDQVNSMKPVFENARDGERGISQVGSARRQKKDDYSEADVIAAMAEIRAKYVRGGKKFYIPTPQYKGLLPHERQAVHRIRESLGGPAATGGCGAARGGGKGGGGASNRAIKALTSNVAQLTAMLSKAQEQEDGPSDDEDQRPQRMESADLGDKRTNAGHPALVRPVKKPRN